MYFSLRQLLLNKLKTVNEFPVSFPLAVVRPGVMHHWRKLVVDVAAAVGKVVWLTGLKIEVVVDWRNVSLVLVWRVVSDRHMLRPRLARRWIREFIGRWNVVEGLLGAGGRRLERNKIII